MKYSLLLGYTATLVFSANIVAAKSVTPVEQIARGAAIEIKLPGSSIVGSGVIIHQQQNIYTVVTSRHLVCGKAGSKCTALSKGNIYNLGTADGQKYQVNVQGVKLLGNNLDLAIMQFKSSKKYVVAQVASVDSLKLDDAVYAAGFPIEQRGITFSKGRTIAVVNKRLTADHGGYTLVYDTFTLPGMSGSGVYDRNGRLVAIHGLGERYISGTELEDSSRLDTKIGVNRGIPIRWMLPELAKLGINLQRVSNQQLTPATVAKTADEYFIIGFNKWVEPGDNINAGKAQAIQEFTTAIRLNPKYAAAYFMRAYTYAQLQDFNKALADIDKAIEIVPSYARSYSNRGFLKSERLNDLPGALQDFNTAIKLDSTDAISYNNRGELKRKMNDISGSLSDYNQAIKLNPRLAEVYNNRGGLYYLKLNNIPAAVADFDKAIEINSNLAIAYYNRGTLKDQKLQDTPGALADFNRTIELNPSLAEVYFSRGTLKKNKLQDRAGAIQDFRKAAQLFQQKGQSTYYRYMLGQLKELGVDE
jgi:tetratricopeptide (TPR) repeat protein